jgi:hypothetical protein
VSSNVELVRSIYAGWERGDFGSTTWADAELEVVTADGPTPESVRLAEIGARWRGFLDAWENVKVEIGECRELDSERVFVLTRWSGKGRSSGLELGRTQPAGASVFHIRDGRVRKLVLYFSPDRALADLGLAREGDANASEAR